MKRHCNCIFLYFPSIELFCLLKLEIALAIPTLFALKIVTHILAVQHGVPMELEGAKLSLCKVAV